MWIYQPWIFDWCMSFTFLKWEKWLKSGWSHYHRINYWAVYIKTDLVFLKFMKKLLITSIFSQHLKTFSRYLKNLWKRDINNSADLWNSLWSKNLHINALCCLHKTHTPFQNRILNMCCKSLICLYYGL